MDMYFLKRTKPAQVRFWFGVWTLIESCWEPYSQLLGMVFLMMNETMISTSKPPERAHSHIKILSQSCSSYQLRVFGTIRDIETRTRTQLENQ